MGHFKCERPGIDAVPAPYANGVPADPPASAGGTNFKELVIQQLIKDHPRLTFSLPETAKLLGISKYLIYQLANRGDFPALELGGRKVVSLIGLVEWVEAQASMHGKRHD